MPCEDRCGNDFQVPAVIEGFDFSSLDDFPELGISAGEQTLRFARTDCRRQNFVAGNDFEKLHGPPLICDVRHRRHGHRKGDVCKMQKFKIVARLFLARLPRDKLVQD